MGCGGGLAQALAATGHGELWSAVSVIALVAAAALVVPMLLRALGHEPHPSPHLVRTTRGQTLTPGLRDELGSLWPRLLKVTLVAYLIQENAERLATQGQIAGIDPLLGPQQPLAIPVIALVTLALAALGSLIRWRILEPWKRVDSHANPSAPCKARTRIGLAPSMSRRSARRRDSIRLRPQAGRAPPLVGQTSPPDHRRPGRRNPPDEEIHPVRTLVRAMAAFAVAAALSLIAAPVLAHEERDVGAYHLEVGLINEPVFVGDKSGLELLVTKDDQPVNGLEGTVKATVAYQGQTRDLRVEATPEVDGSYWGSFIPTAAGPYTFHLTGTIEGQSLDESFTSSPTGFDEVQEAAPNEFPVQFPTTAELASQAKQGADAASQVTLALALGAAGVVLGIVGIGVSVWSRRTAA